MKEEGIKRCRRPVLCKEGFTECVGGRENSRNGVGVGSRRSRLSERGVNVTFLDTVIRYLISLWRGL